MTGSSHSLFHHLVQFCTARLHYSGLTRHSIVRRSMLVTMFFISGHGFYYLLLLVANVLLDPAGFGRLYTGWAILNVLVTPVSIIALLLSGFFAKEFTAHGPSIIPQLLARIATIALPWTAAAVALLEALFYAAGISIGVDSTLLILVVPPTAASFLGVEVVRAAFQGMLRFTAFGVSWLAWCAAQCVLGAGGLFLFGAPWACFAGMMLANILTLVCVFWFISATCPPAPRPFARRLPAEVFSFTVAFPFCSAFIGFVVFNNSDILFAYLSLSPVELGGYTASSVLPKAIVTATQPVVQIILPVVISIINEGRDTQLAVQKAVTVALALGVLGFVVLWLGSDLVCSEGHGIRFCNSSLMLTLAAAAVPLAVVRTLMTADLARGRYRISHLPFGANLLFIGTMLAMTWVRPVGEAKIATIYLLSCWALLASYAVVKIAQNQLLAERKALTLFSINL
jgi:O-antigen/teichoic acid export membrane protein